MRAGVWLFTKELNPRCVPLAGRGWGHVTGEREQLLGCGRSYGVQIPAGPTRA